MQKKIAVSMRGITKRFGSVVANNSVDLDVYQGEILAVLGENGCGKTTLMNMLAGIYYPDEGQIFVDGREVVIRSPKDAYALKIGMVHQHFKLVDLFTASENVVLGLKEEGRYNLKKVNEQVAEIAEKYGFHIEPQKRIYDMSVSEKQTVEIIKMLYRGADILILDEPTAVLTPQEITRLFDVLRRMKADGKSIIIITHKLHEVLSVSDRVAILRKGERVGTVETAQTSESELTEMMVGKKVSLNIERNAPVNASPRLLVRGLTTKSEDGRSAVRDVSFTVNGGEIFGIAGIAGSGQKELLEAIAGLQPVESGEIEFINPKKDRPVTFYHKSLKRVVELADKNAFHDGEGKPVSFKGMTRAEIRRRVNHGDVLFREDEVLSLRDKTPLQIRSLGIHLSFVPEDRLGMGLVGGMGITDNMMLRSYRKGHAGFVDRKKPRRQAEEIIRELEVITPGVNVPVRRLSGGNIQKVLLGREIAFTPKLLMAAYPVRGLDINSSYIIYNLLNRQKKNGVAVIFVGEDLDVLLELCDRIMVINSGAVTGIVDARTATKEEIGLLMTKTDDTAKENA
ncbi:MAG: ABC transporter ATP-binding protein [Eubacteriales bacterium]|nr:ABC transporter ATP-binding protein [Clostridiales bacterium]MDY2770637.1 ABC transporter ATP-binding protein [Eubacteriales bacterium]